MEDNNSVQVFVDDEMTGRNNSTGSNDFCMESIDSGFAGEPKQLDKVVNKTLVHDSVGLVFGISIVGGISSLLTFHSFDLSAESYNFSTLTLSAIIMILTAIDIFASCRNYSRRSVLKGTTYVFSTTTIVLSSLLILVPLLYSGGFVDINDQFELHLSNGNITIVDWICSKTGYLTLRSFIRLYPITFGLQALSNLFRHLLKKRKKKKRPSKWDDEDRDGSAENT